jgi:hypothetical protein
MSKRDLYIKAKLNGPCPSIPVGAKPLKTNQTTSFRTGDDGDTQRGRAVSLLTLASNNPFGNTNRFTALDGTQTYTDSIILDWNTYDGVSVLGYCTADIAVGERWNNQTDNANAATHGGYTDWTICNAFELMNIANFASGNNAMISLNYAPFNVPDSVHIWTSTTGERADGLTVSAIVRSTANILNLIGKTTNGVRRIDVRYFTNAELGI